MNFPSIDIQGSIISGDILGKIRSEQASFQQGKDFNKDFSNSKLKDEISSAWQDAKAQWTIYQNKINRLKTDESATTETRNFWILPLLTNLGYNLNFSRQSEEFNGKSFNIPYADSQLDSFPVYIAGFNESIDKRPENKQIRVSPHALLQEYLNYSEHLYGLVTNGKHIRLLRDASRITRLSYVEFNLQKMMEEDLYSDFVLFFRLLHTSRMPIKKDLGPESIIEKYHQEGLAIGSTIRSKLGDAVKESIKALANDFISHPDNNILREALNEGNLNADDFYHHLLRIIYRFLFLFVIEERNLVYAENRTPETRRFSQIYFRSYSLLRLRKLAHKLPPPDAGRNWDLWQGLLSTFALFEKKETGEKLGIMSLQGELFSEYALRSNVYDLHDCKLSNAVLLRVLRSLSYFENDNKALSQVNYGGLDVEEFGSVYEGLLELKLRFEPIAGSENWTCDFDRSNARGTSGSHYTPEELVQPLIKHSLEYLIEERIKPYKEKKATKDQTVQALLSLKICDVACGSGHILLSAARKLALEIAKVQTDEDQPNPSAIRKAIKQVVRQCIYGVDKNPLAVELCKVALWLETHNPGEPLNFLDHHIKCGDAIVGLAHRDELEKGIPDEAFKTLPGDDKEIAKSFRDKNHKERKERLAKELQLKAQFEKTTENSVNESMEEYRAFNALPERTPEEIERKAKAYKKFIDGKGMSFLKAMADAQVSQFFIPKTLSDKEYIMTDGEFRQILSGYNEGWQNRKVAKASVISSENSFFHWFLAFPEVISNGGFDCILGNPPYLGNVELNRSTSSNYVNQIKNVFQGVRDKADLVTFFVRRAHGIINKSGFLSLITTNTITQGDTRIGSLEQIVSNGGKIIFGIKSMKWPGKANVWISLFSITNKSSLVKYFLGNREVEIIDSRLESSLNGNPFTLRKNLNICYRGSMPSSDLFFIEEDSIATFPENEKIFIQKIISGEELYNDFNFTKYRLILNLNSLIENNIPPHIKSYIERLRKERQTKFENALKEKKETQRLKNLYNSYWKFEYHPNELYLSNKKKVIALTRVSKTHAPRLIPINTLVTDSIVLFNTESYSLLSILQSELHSLWAWQYCSTLKADRRYTPTDGFETFPLPNNNEEELNSIGYSFDLHREKILRSMETGLTKLYNYYNSSEINEGLLGQNLLGSDRKTLLHTYTINVWNLVNHLQKTANGYSMDEAIKGIIKLRQLHVQMDNTVAYAYGWSDIQLSHNFYELDYLPENDRVRFTIHPDARKEILKRLLELNHKIHEEEVKAGLWEKKTTKEYKIKKSKSKTAEEAGEGYGGLFESTNYS